MEDDKYPAWMYPFPLRDRGTAVHSRCSSPNSSTYQAQPVRLLVYAWSSALGIYSGHHRCPEAEDAFSDGCRFPGRKYLRARRPARSARHGPARECTWRRSSTALLRYDPPTEPLGSPEHPRSDVVTRQRGGGRKVAWRVGRRPALAVAPAHGRFPGPYVAGLIESSAALSAEESAVLRHAVTPNVIAEDGH
jgi:hypothetical protein